MAGGTFEADVRLMINNAKQNLLIVAQASIQDVVNAAQLARAKGGRMPIDTGFLRASGQGSFTGLPTGPTIGESKVKFFYDDGSSPSYTVQLTGLKLGGTFYFGWTAVYAKYMNNYYGFLDVAVQRWQEFVDKNVAKVNSISRRNYANANGISIAEAYERFEND